MVSFTTSALAAFIGVAAATGRGWGGAPSYQCPGNPKQPAPVCSSQQASGWDWSGLQYGSFQTSYDGMSFSCGNGASWKYTNGLFGQGSAFSGRGLEARTGRGGCMSADLKDTPSYSCGGGRSFNAASFSLVSERDTDIEIVFTQKGGGKCSQFARCSKQGTTVKNNQCGDATSVTFKHRGEGGSCGLGVSSVSYASCTKTTTFPAPPPQTSSSTTSASTSVATTTSTQATTTTSSSSSTDSIILPTVTPPPSSTTTLSSIITTQSVSTIIITTGVTVSACSATGIDCPASSTSISSTVLTSYTTVPVSVPTTIQTVTSLSTTTDVKPTTVYVTTSTTICPVTLTHITNNQTVTSTYLTTSLIPKTITSATVSTLTTIPSVSLTTSEIPPVTTTPAPSSGGCPGSVPSCLNSWLHLVPNCKDNTDSACFCAAANFTESIIDCLEAYSGADLSDAISYFQGICAPYAGQNPQPFTGVPTTITVTAPAVPQTTVTITASGSTATVTVPAVTFSTPEASGTSPAGAGLVPIGGSTTIPIIVPTTPAATPEIPSESTTVAVGTGSFTASVPSSTGPAIVTGAGSRMVVSGGLNVAVVVAAILLL